MLFFRVGLNVQCKTKQTITENVISSRDLAQLVYLGNDQVLRKTCNLEF